MPRPPLYTDRDQGPTPRTRSTLSDATSRGLIALVQQKIEQNYLAEEFPDRCSEHGYIIGTSDVVFSEQARAVIPALKWPVWQNKGVLPDDDLFDLLEYVGQRVSLPVERDWHPFPKHFRLEFKKGPGRTEYRGAVNELLSRGGAAFEMDADLIVVRIETPEFRELLGALNPATGDRELDALIETARTLYLSRKVSDRLNALQTFWAAFERLKTLDVPVPKKKNVSVQALLDNIESEPVRTVVEADMQALTDIGNKFRIRHHETYIENLPEELYGYFVGRMANLLLTLLEQSDRLAGE